jgi:hypothetical protein
MIGLLPWILLAVVAFFALRRPGSIGPVVLPSIPPLSPLPMVPPAVANENRLPVLPRAAGPHPLALASALVAGAMISWAIASRPAPLPSPDKPPAPAPAGWPTIDLRGAFVGEHAAEDALTTHYLLKWLSRWIAYDSTLPQPRLKTAAAFDELRRVARDGRMEGGTLGQRQPLAKERIKAFLDAAVGDAGGPVDAAGKPNFIRAFEDVSKAAAEAVGRKPE